MRSSRLAAGLASASLVAVLQAGGAIAQTGAPMPSTVLPAVHTMAPMPAGTLAVDARFLRARRTATGYTLTSQARVSDACQAARFDPSMLTIFPPQFNLDQFRRPGTLGMMCMQRLIWVTAQPRAVTSAHPPRFITVRTQKGVVHVPIP